MGFMEELVLVNHINIQPLIIPTVLIPLTLLSMGLSVVATFVAGLFGVELKTEGPRRLLELLFKPRFLISALLLNSFFFVGVKAYQFLKTYPSFIYSIEKNNPEQHLFRNINKQSSGYFKFSSGDKIYQDNFLKLPKGSFAGITIDKDRLYLGSADGNIYELDKKTFEILRKFFVGTFVTTKPLIWKNYLVSGEGVHSTHHARIYLFNLYSGELEHYYATEGHTEGSPVISSYSGKDYLIAVSGGDGVHGVDLSNLKNKEKELQSLWKQNLGHSDASVVVNKNRVFLGTGREKGDSQKHRSYASSLDIESGKTYWKRELPASSWMEPIIYKDQVCFVYGEVYFESGLGGVECFSQKEGLPTLGFRTLEPIASTATVFQDHLYVADVKGNLYSYNLKQKKLVWKQETGVTQSASYSSPIVNPLDQNIYFSSQMNGLWVFNKKGETLAHWKPSKEESPWGLSYSAVLIDEDRLLTIDMQGNLRSFKIQ